MPDPATARPADPLATLAAMPALPLQGLTVLAVEDSRFASDALRLMCQRSGARLRRADCLAAAQRHLRTYRPDVAIVDMGLPDGRGEDLIRILAALQPPRPVVIGTSGTPDARAAARLAGADGFLDKPVESLASFQATLLQHLPDRTAPPDTAGDARLRPDPMALLDDLRHAADLLAATPQEPQARYLAGFLTGVARIAHDSALESAAHNMARHPGNPAAPALAEARALIARRLASGGTAFATR